jgi:hypothetical protein
MLHYQISPFQVLSRFSFVSFLCPSFDLWQTSTGLCYSANNAKHMLQHRSDLGANQIYNPYYIVSARVKQVEKLIKILIYTQRTQGTTRKSFTFIRIKIA